MAETKLTAEQQTSIMYYAQKDGCPNGHSPNCGKICYECVEDALRGKCEAIAQQQAEHERVLAVLREHEWGYCGKWCDICDSTKKYGHKSDCWLAALLAADKEKGNE